MGRSFFVKWGLGLLLLVLSGPALGQTDAEIEEVFWESVVCERAREVELYLEIYPTGRYVAEAHECLEEQLGLDRAARILVQRGLAALEYEVGAADGLFGPATRQALRQWQAGKGFAGTGYLTRAQAETLMAQGREVVAEQRQREEARRQAQAEAARQQQGAERRRAAEAERQAEAARQRTQPGATFRDCPTCPQMVVVPVGSYRMGSPSYEEGRYDNEGPEHRVTIGQPFAVGVYEVTRGDYGRFVGATGHAGGTSCDVWEGGSWEERSGRNWRNPGYRQSEREPVVCVNWRDARTYVEWLSRETGESYRLLSEAEWEYVARAGTTTARYWGEREAGQCRYANGADSRTDLDWRLGCDDGYARTAPAGSYQANGFGLYDVLGNVWEWTQDCWKASYGGAPRDGRAWEWGECSHRVLRGGSWYDFPGILRSAFRFRSTADLRGRLHRVPCRPVPPLSLASLPLNLSLPRGRVPGQTEDARASCRELRREDGEPLARRRLIEPRVKADEPYTCRIVLRSDERGGIPKIHRLPSWRSSERSSSTASSSPPPWPTGCFRISRGLPTPRRVTISACTKRAELGVAIHRVHLWSALGPMSHRHNAGNGRSAVHHQDGFSRF